MRLAAIDDGLLGFVAAVGLGVLISFVVAPVGFDSFVVLSAGC